MKNIFKRTMFIVSGLLSAFILVACGPTDAVKDTLIVGSPELNGNFIGGFGNSAYDVWVRNLIFGYATVSTTPGGQLVINETVVKDFETTTATRNTDAGTVEDKTYTFTLNENLLWSDGAAITAKDFVYGILFAASKEWQTAGATDTTGDSLLGYAAYRAGSTSAGVGFKGVQLLGDYEFSVTIDGAKLPYFYEYAFVSFAPLPFHYLAPAGAQVVADAEDGASLSAGSLSNVRDHTLIGGYRYQPAVSAGPYKFVSFVNQVVTLTKDENFKGNYEGKTPSIKNVVIRRINQSLDVDLVISGEVDLVTGVIEGAKIQAAQAAANVNLNYYARNGYGYFAMVAHMEPTSDYRVRQAVAHLTDRQYVADQVLEGYGSMVYSEYGLAQWMYQESEAWVDENLNKYEFSVAAANALLDQTDYKFESNGTTPFNAASATAGSGYFRYNSAGEKLVIKHFGTENNAVTDSLAAKFELNLQLAGIEYDVTIGTFDTLLNHYYGGAALPTEQKEYSTFNLAVNFAVAYDPYYSWSEHLAGTQNNPHALIDTPENPAAPLVGNEKTLQELIEALRVVEPGDNATYLALWRQYQLRWNKLIPNVPLYSNQYYDVYTSKLKFDGVTTSPFWTWANVVPYMYFE